MKSFIYYISAIILLFSQVRAIQLNSVSSYPLAYVEIADNISNAVATQWQNHLDSFVDLVSTKIVDNIGREIAMDDTGKYEHLVVLLENDAELFDLDSYEAGDISFIQDQFISKLKEKFNKSKFGQHLKKLGSKLKSKLQELYLKHKDKLKKFFKVMLTTLVIPVAIKFIKKHLKQWRTKTIDATKNLDKDTLAITLPVINSIYDKFGEQIDKYAEQNNISVQQEINAIKELEKDKHDIEELEEQENVILDKSAN